MASTNLLQNRNIDPPPYAEGTFDVPKVKLLVDYVLGRSGWVIEIEGGKRGSKDVVGIAAWAKFLMVTPDREHLVLGKTLEHAIVTVLNSQGFGLRYAIPSGEFVRESVGGAGTRGLFKFIDAYGVEKKIYFYGNEKKDDYSKFKGFTLGSVYINEANEQHINGLREAKDRTNSAMRPRIVVTQNPKGASHVFYTEFEDPLIYSDEEDLELRNIKSRFEEAFSEKQEEMLNQMEVERKALVREFLSNRGIKKAKLLPRKEYAKLLNKVRNLKEGWNKKIRNLMVSDFTNDYADPGNQFHNKLHKASMKLVLDYVPKFENPNDVKNGLEFAYFHFTHYDNPSMSDTDRSRVERTYNLKSPTFKKDIMGERATVENSIWPTFNEDNIYDHEIPYSRVMARVIGLDLGYDHPFAGVDAFIMDDYSVLIHNEIFIKPKEKKELANNKYYIEHLQEKINEYNEGEYDRIRVDPSARGFINQLVSDGFIALPAKNQVRNRKTDDVKESDRTRDKKIFGIDLVREGFELNKIKIHRRCTNTIKQVQGYEFDTKKLEVGVETPFKINDDLPDALRYVVNSDISYVFKWHTDGSENVDYGEQLQTDKVSRKKDKSEPRDQDEIFTKQKEFAESLIKAFKESSGHGSGLL